jgi:hypothetical protein
MADNNPIGDDEIILRHIPGGPSYQQPPGPRITSLNFRLRPGESGVSVTRESITPAARLLAIVGGDPAAGSKVAVARAGDIRTLGLAVVAAPTDDDPGHAEIRSEMADLTARSVCRALAQVFRFLPVT